MEKKMNFFEKYLTLWVVLCMIAGVIIGRNFPLIIDSLRIGGTNSNPVKEFYYLVYLQVLNLLEQDKYS